MHNAKYTIDSEEDGKADLEDGKADLEDGKADLEGGKADLEGGKADLEGGKADLEGGKEDLRIDLPNSGNLTEHIITDAEEVYKSSRRRHETLFYKVVIGGCHEQIAAVLVQLKSSESHRALFHWLVYGGYTTTVVKTRGQYCNKTFKYLLLIPLWIVLTPFFYLFHSFINSLFNSARLYKFFSASRYENINFPLTFAVFSGSKEMLKLFLDLGIAIDSKDELNNNILHYLADLSGFHLERAKKCYSTICEFVGTEYLTKETLHKMVKYEENHHMQNSIEYATQFGSLQFASQLISDTMTKTLVQVTRSKVLIAEGKQQYHSMTRVRYNTNNSAKKDKTTNNASDIEGSKQVTMNITPYSLFHRHGFVSHLLHLITERNTMAISADNWYCIHNNICIQKWISLKIQQWSIVIGFNILIDLTVTFVLILGMLQNSQGDMNLTPNKQIFTKAHIEVFLSKWQATTAGNETIFSRLGDEFFLAYPDLESELSSGNKRMDYVEMLSLIKALPNYEEFDNMTDLYKHICTDGNYTMVGDLVEIDNCTKEASDVILGICEETNSRYQYYFVDESYDNYDFVIATSFLTPVYNHTRSVFKNPLRVTLSKTTAYGLLFFLAAYFSIYILLDVYCRFVVLLQQIRTGITFYSIFATPLQGSALKGACNIFCSCSYLLVVFYYWNSIAVFYGNPQGTSERNNLLKDILNYDRNKDLSINNNFILALCMVFMMVSRIVLHLHNMKIIPWIGTFVITTFQMAADLFKFALVYMVMVFVFSVMFHLLSRDTVCPSHRNAENYFLYDSYFNTFALTFGHIDMPYDNNAVKITYIVYVVLSIILLLNLIIAVMSSTAANVTAEPWASQLYVENLLSEAIGMESWTFTLFPFSSVVRLSHKLAGYQIDTTEDGKTVVRVNVFKESEI